MRLRKPLAVMAAGALAVSLAACGGGSGNDGNKKDGSSFKGSDSAGSGKDASRQGPAADIKGATKGGTVTVLFPSPDTGPSTLDPSASWSVTGNAIMQDLTSRSLTAFSYDAKTKKMVLVPDLATDLGQHNADFTEWTFTIKDGQKYDNGQPIKAADFAWAIARSFDEADIVGAGSLYSASYFLDGDKYKGPYSKENKGEDYKGVTVDGNKLTIKMAKPFSDMDYWGAFETIGPIPKGAVSDPPKYGLKPWATGPYKVESFEPEKSLTLVRNENWDAASDPARHAYPDKWIFKFDQDPASTDALALSSNANADTLITSSVLAENYAKAKSEIGERLVQGTSPCTAFLAPNIDKITDIKIRQAIAFAYPYEDTWSAGGEVVGVTRVPGNTIMPPGMAGRKEYGPIDGKQVTHDVEKAKALLKEAGVQPNTYELSWVFKAGDPQAIAAKNQTAAAYKEAGFVPKPLPYDGSAYDVWTATDDDTSTAGKLQKQINLNGTAWCADWPSALTFLPALLKTGETYNTANFSEKAVDDRMAEIPSLPAAEQPGAWMDLDKEVTEKYYPLINTGYTNNLMIYGKKIGNFTNDEVMGAPNYKDIFVKQ